MKLINKLTVFIALSKLVVVLLFVLSLPFLVERIASAYTNSYLRQQQRKVNEVIGKNGIDYYLQGSNSYGSYTLLKEEYIAIESLKSTFFADTIENTQRIIESDTLNYRVLIHTFKFKNRNYLLEIGKTAATISQYNKPLQRIASYVLIGLIVVTLIADLVFTRFLLRPLNEIIKSKLVNRNFPFKDNIPPVKTTTADFKYLDNSLINLMNQVHEAFEKEREFTANASHELMTPVTILQNKIENLIDDSELNIAFQQRLVDMHRTLNRLKKIVNSLLLISRIENEQFGRAESWNVVYLFQSILDEIGHRMEAKRISVKLELDPKSEWKNVNRDLMFQFLYNLINNAIKYNKEKGSILIKEGRTSQNAYELIVEDSGVGISKENLPQIFDRFRKYDSGNNEGYGLGLSIVKSIADYHSIKISVDSVIGEKTRFTLTFPKNIIS